MWQQTANSNLRGWKLQPMLYSVRLQFLKWPLEGGLQKGSTFNGPHINMSKREKMCLQPSTSLLSVSLGTKTIFALNVWLLVLYCFGLYFVMLLFLIWNPMSQRASLLPLAFRFLILIAFWGFSTHVHKMFSLYYVFIMYERYQLAVATPFPVAQDIQSLIHYVSLLSCSQGCEARTKCQYPCCHVGERWEHLGHVDSL